MKPIASSTHDIVTERRPRRAHRQTPTTIPAPTPTDADLLKERRLVSLILQHVVVSPEIQVELAHWASLATAQDGNMDSLSVARSREMEAAYAASILRKLVRNNPGICPSMKGASK